MLRILSPLRGICFLSAVLTTGCASSLPEDPPPLVDMEEPLALFEVPDDEAQRRTLPLGVFTGAYVSDVGDTLEDLLGGTTEGVTIARIVENSPAAVAGLVVGDLLVEARVDSGEATALQHASQWRRLELDCAPGARIDVVYDRAGRRGSAALEVLARVEPPERDGVERLREEQRVGVVVRTATEVEARAAGLGPGGGAVVVGLSKRSPWRVAGLGFGDLLVTLDGRSVEAPAVVLEAIRTAGSTMTIELVRAGERQTITAPLTRRATETREIFIPLLFSYEADRGRSDTSMLFGLFRHETTEAAWRVRLLWLIWFGGGDADRLLEVDQ